MTKPPQIFDRKRYAVARARAASKFAAHDFLHRRAMSDIVDRLETVTRSFDAALFYGAAGLEDLVTPACGIGAIIHADMTDSRLCGAGPAIVYDEEHSPLRDQSFDLIVSLLTLHAANDPVGALGQIRRALRPDGLFIGAAFGENTLVSMKRAMTDAESEASGGAAIRFPPFAGVRDFGAALQRAGFALPVVDLDKASVRYRDPSRLFADLRGMGETGYLRRRSPPLKREVLAHALASLASAGGEEEFDLIYMTGWAPHSSQQKPLKPGSAQHSLADAVRKSEG